MPDAPSQAGTRYIAVMSDAQGLATGGVSSIMTIAIGQSPVWFPSSPTPPIPLPSHAYCLGHLFCLKLQVAMTTLVHHATMCLMSLTGFSHKASLHLNAQPVESKRTKTRYGLCKWLVRPYSA